MDHTIDDQQKSKTHLSHEIEYLVYPSAALPDP